MTTKIAKIVQLCVQYDGEEFPIILHIYLNDFDQAIARLAWATRTKGQSTIVKQLVGWCENQFGNKGFSYTILREYIQISFRNEEDAALFKLVHG